MPRFPSLASVRVLVLHKKASVVSGCSLPYATTIFGQSFLVAHSKSFEGALSRF